jgi:hypothetical protein
MTGENALKTAPRRGVLGVSGVLRLVVLALTLTGFVAMHGVASSAAGAHCGAPPALVTTSDAHGGAYGVPHGLTADHGTTTAVAHLASVGAGVGAPMPSPNSDDLMVGCLLALLGALMAIGLRLLGWSGTSTATPGVRRAGAWLRTARAPPNPLFLSLCVFRL